MSVFAPTLPAGLPDLNFPKYTNSPGFASICTTKTSATESYKLQPNEVYSLGAADALSTILGTRARFPSDNLLPRLRRSADCQK